MITRRSWRQKILVVLGIMLCIGLQGNAAEVCEFSLKDCPESYHNQTINVPMNVVAMAKKFTTCEPTKVIEGVVDSSAPPAIVFIIDNSWSMSGYRQTNGGNDEDGVRFKVTRDMIDSIYKINKNAEVGVVVFTEKLYFDAKNNNVVKALPGYGDQSYIPLLKLNSQVNGSLGKDVLQGLLATKEMNQVYNGVTYRFVNLIYTPTSFTVSGSTNITLAFNAAKAAMSGTTYANEKRFFIFLSDGEPNPSNQPDSWHFRDSVKATPTTFTVYLSRTTNHPNLNTMTRNIQNSGYSTSNPKSEIWDQGANYATLMPFLMENILNPVIFTTTSRAKRVLINNIESRALKAVDFNFLQPFPLKADTTMFNVQIDYTVNLQDGKTKDTTTKTLFTVKRQAGPASNSITLNCWQQGTISLYNNNVKITQVDETMNTLEIRYTPGDISVSNVSLQVTNSTTDPKENENFTLTNRTTYFNTTFPSIISDKPTPNDNRFQHQLSDSIIIIYRNPQIPLDTIRVAYPIVVNNAITISNAAYFDNNSDGYIDSIALTGNVKLTFADLEALKQKLVLPGFRNFTIKAMAVLSNGVGLSVSEGRSGEPITSIQNGEQIEVLGGVLPGSGYINGSKLDITDKVAPVIVVAEMVYGETKDSLIVRFSEAINGLTSPASYLFRKPNAKENYQVTIATPGSKVENTVTAIVTGISGATSIEANDSVWINGAANIGDISGNIQKDQNNRRVLLTVKTQPYALVPRVINNPYVPSNNMVWPPFIKQIYNQNNDALPNDGIIIVMEPNKPIRSDNTNGNNPSLNFSSAKMNVYDVVKNLIARDIPVYLDAGSGKFATVWDCYNMNNRLVATGTYTAMITVTNKDGKKSNVGPVFIGVNRSKSRK
jgi:hypothetical protein